MVTAAAKETISSYSPLLTIIRGRHKRLVDKLHSQLAAKNTMKISRFHLKDGK